MMPGIGLSTVSIQPKKRALYPESNAFPLAFGHQPDRIELTAQPIYGLQCLQSISTSPQATLKEPETEQAKMEALALELRGQIDRGEIGRLFNHYTSSGLEDPTDISKFAFGGWLTPFGKEGMPSFKQRYAELQNLIADTASVQSTVKDQDAIFFQYLPAGWQYAGNRFDPEKQLLTIRAKQTDEQKLPSWTLLIMESELFRPDLAIPSTTPELQAFWGGGTGGYKMIDGSRVPHVPGSPIIRLSAPPASPVQGATEGWKRFLPGSRRNSGATPTIRSVPV